MNGGAAIDRGARTKLFNCVSLGIQCDLLGAESRVIGRGACKNDNLQPAIRREIEHSLNNLHAPRIGIRERVVENDGQATVVRLGEQFSECQTHGSSELLFRAAAQVFKLECAPALCGPDQRSVFPPPAFSTS